MNAFNLHAFLDTHFNDYGLESEKKFVQYIIARAHRMIPIPEWTIAMQSRFLLGRDEILELYIHRYPDGFGYAIDTAQSEDKIQLGEAYKFYPLEILYQTVQFILDAVHNLYTSS